MKFVLFLLFNCLLTFSSIFSQSPSQIIGKPYKFYNIEIAEFKFLNEMSYYEAEKSCKELGADWRLPTPTELKLILTNPYRKKIFNAEFDQFYWATCNQPYYGCDSNISYVVNNRTDFRFGVYYPTYRIIKKSKQKVIAVRNDSSSLINITANSINESVIGKPNKIGNIEIAQFDLPLIEDGNWYINQERCRNLGKGWRLPTKKEMILIYKNKQIIKNLRERDYWTYTTIESEVDNSLAYNFKQEDWVDTKKSSSYPIVRAVRYIPSSVLGKPIKLGKLLIAQNSFEEKMTWIDAVNVCAGLGEGWRLPTIEELNFLQKNLTKIKNLLKIDARNYWSSSNDNDINKVFMKNFYDDGLKTWLKYYDLDPFKNQEERGGLIAVKSLK